MSDLLPVEEAQERLLSRAYPIGEQQTIALADAEGRVLSADLTARITQPPFDASAMDGYAVFAGKDLAPGAEFSVIGTAAAGHAFEGSVGPGEAVRIFTGAPVPAGADTILLQEDATLTEIGIRAAGAIAKGHHIRRKGQDFAHGETVLPRGAVMDYSRLMVAAGMNRPSIDVYRKPVVAILATGDELLLPGSTPGPGQIIASSGFAVAALAKSAGAEVVDLGIAPDDTAAIGEAVNRAREAGADILVTLGGASVGDHDLVKAALSMAGMKLDFWRIAMRPGKPLMVGSLDHIHVLGLPGNPVSTLVCALLFLEPLIRRLAHLPPILREIEVKAAVGMKANDHRQDYVRARFVPAGDGVQMAEPFQKQDSSMMKVFAQADCLIIRRPNAPALAPGAPCPALLLRV